MQFPTCLPLICSAFITCNRTLNPSSWWAVFQCFVKKYLTFSGTQTHAHGIYHKWLVDSCDDKTYLWRASRIQGGSLEWACMSIRHFPTASHINQTTSLEWFMKYKAREFCEHTLRYLREAVSLGSPPKPFYTNDNESCNQCSSQGMHQLQETAVVAHCHSNKCLTLILLSSNPP